MGNTVRKALVALPSLAVLLALGGCGDRIENTEMPLAQQHPSVEINRQGMKGAGDVRDANGVAHQTASSGEEREHRRGILGWRG